MTERATLRHRRIGAALRAHRVNAGLTLERVAHRLTPADAMSAAKISRIENGQYAVNPHDVRALCRVYDLDQSATDELVDQASQALRRTWWQEGEAGVLPAPFQRYLEYEDTCVALDVFAPVFVPDILQTAAYTRMLIAGLWPDKNPGERQALASVLTRRQSRLAVEAGPRVQVVLDAHAVLRSWGDRSVAVRQAAYLLEVSRHPRTEVRVIPDGRVYPGAHTGFTLMTLGSGDKQGKQAKQVKQVKQPAPGAPAKPAEHVGFVGGVVGWCLVDGGDEIDRYTLTFQQQRAAALGPEETRRWLRLAIKSMGGVG
ncbi:transcriptional regulator, XRE family [Catenulispora acidiphila DSM 44928]|uniref:Transcriptional regulator, XRE family n=1 Tax=Catenulispora acidiphila (strain DSM 44928 / JCM 14897 / NBRC 102108 / NRRL B-24433 / ID139908) TaxID=479433 RepID=C7Q6E1_CATAD|nr:helix-turn-helix transcriptional regulator [Catenulispora acidiphila]ACU72147.1 transcriptional regulator, XRE family [Catenulispora acidiphila DSM 44928]